MGENGRYLPSAQLKAQFETVLGQTKAEEAVFYCGSGVTACVNLLAMAEAGLGTAVCMPVPGVNGVGIRSGRLLQKFETLQVGSIVWRQRQFA
ncbi:MAG: hypothetical protein M5U34_34845 [Chloroflexi bacterium]|nr:hypothetical protein [Chloroflexota bacterium]